jgi:prepilin-type N-terminal cleavage/methylation domain-containing protein/prepilin-type processing-associated H-X9-DG protein
MKPRSLSITSFRPAFTLIELLTVIAIIGILAAILIPTVGAVRKKAAQAKAQSGLRQIGQTFYTYSQDNKGYFPKPGGNRLVLNSNGNPNTAYNDFSWDAELVRYWNIPFVHATESGYEEMPKPGGFVSLDAEGFMKHPLDTRKRDDATRGVRSWGMNLAFQAKGPWRIERMKKPLSKTILVSGAMTDDGTIFFIASGSGAGIDSSWQLNGENIKPGLDFYKNGKADYLMADGHIMVTTPADAKNNPQFYWTVY